MVLASEEGGIQHVRGLTGNSKRGEMMEMDGTKLRVEPSGQASPPLLPMNHSSWHDENAMQR